MHVALIYPPFDDKRDRSAYYIAPPLGLLLIASCLENSGHRVSIFDFIFELKKGNLDSDVFIYDRCVEKILASNPDLVCISTQCTTNPGALNILRRIKERRPNCKTLLGGHDVSFLAIEYLKNFKYVDFVLSGEAERTCALLAGSLSNNLDLSFVPGLTYRHSDEIRSNKGALVVEDLDSLPKPAHHLVAPLKEYFRLSRRPTILVDSGRGCAFKCEFCQTTLLTGDAKIRYRSIPSLISELRFYKEQYGDYEAYFVHDLFTAKRSFVESFCRALINENLGISWQCRCRIDQIDEALLELMRAAGCRMLLYGIESGAESTLILMNKKLRHGVADQTLDRVKLTVAAGIFPSLSMVIGTPEETVSDLNATMTLASDFIKLGNVNAFIQLMSPLPGTALAARLMGRMEYYGERAPTAFNQGIEFNQGQRLTEDEQLIVSHPEIFQSFQCVVPDHGDFSICVDITLAYCKLLEVYNRSFRALARFLDINYYHLFREYRDYYRLAAGVDGFYGVRDSQIWAGFLEFFHSRVGSEHNYNRRLFDIIRLESVINAIATELPVDADTISRSSPSAKFRLKPAARVVMISPSLVDEECSLDESEVTPHIVFATRDRINFLEITKNVFNVLSLLNDAQDSSSEALFTKLRAALNPLDTYKLLENV